MLTVHQVAKTFTVRSGTVGALDGVDLTVPEGSFTAILGASGSGKTTLLRAVAGFERIDHGTITLDGRMLAGDGVHLRPEDRGIGIVTQNGALFPHLDVAGNVGFGLAGRPGRWRSGAARQRRDRIAELLELVDLRGHEHRRVDELSGGQQQRIALARALAPRPALILLDEPFSALDSTLRAELRVQVRNLLRTLGTTALLVTHDQDEALSLADQVALMRSGRVVQAGAAEDIYARPVDIVAARSVGDAVILPAHVVGHDHHVLVLECALGRVCAEADEPLAVGATCRVVIRPQHLVPTRDGVPAKIIGRSYFGRDRLLTLRLDTGRDGVQVRMRTSDDAVERANGSLRPGVSGTAFAVPLAPADDAVDQAVG